MMLSLARLFVVVVVVVCWANFAAASATTTQRYRKLHLVGNTENPTGLVIWAHGLNEKGSQYKPMATELSKTFPHLLFALPTAPVRAIKKASVELSTWYKVGIRRADMNELHLRDAAKYLQLLGTALCEKYKIPTINVVYGGYHQGAAVAFTAGLTAPIRPKALFAASIGDLHYFGDEEFIRQNAQHLDTTMFVADKEYRKPEYTDFTQAVGYTGDAYYDEVVVDDETQLNTWTVKGHKCIKPTYFQIERPQVQVNLKQWLMKLSFSRT